MSSNINISDATIALIDSLKSTTNAFGLAGTGSKYRIVTEMFLYSSSTTSLAMMPNSMKSMANACVMLKNGMLYTTLLPTKR